MEGKLAKNSYSTSVDFKFNINSTRNPVLKDVLTRAIRKCKSDMTLALINDLQKSYNSTKAQIAKVMTDLERFLNPEQLQEIKDSLSSKFKQMSPIFMEKKQFQCKDGRKNLVPRRLGSARGQQNDPRMNKLINTLRSMSE